MPTGFTPSDRLRNRNKLKQDLPQTPLTNVLQDNLQAVQTAMGQSDDLVIREFPLGSQGAVRAAVVYVAGLVELSIVDDFVVRSLAWAGSAPEGDPDLLRLKETVLNVADVSDATTLGQVLAGILDGKTAILVDGHPAALLAATTGWKGRQVSEPMEGVVRGSQEGFIEELTTNITLVRRRIRHPRLRVQKMKVGTITQTSVAILHVDGVAREEILAEVRSRLSRIEIDGILESAYIEELIEDAPWSPFPQIAHTDRPDKVAAALLEGQIAIFTDNTPLVLLAPYTFIQSLQSPEDYFERWPISSLTRILRLVGIMITLYLPALYVAVITYHHEMIPLGLALNIAGGREGAPFPAVVEALVMEVMFELLREAGLRLPRAVGQAVSIVGGLVVGDSAVRAGLVGAPMVIVVALTGIASFAIPAFNMALTLRLLRFPIIAVGAVAGLPGITLTGLVMICHLAGLRSFGVPYLSPLTPGDVTAWKDVFLRAPWSTMIKRPPETAVDQTRQRARSRRWPPR